MLEFIFKEPTYTFKEVQQNSVTHFLLHSMAYNTITSSASLRQKSEESIKLHLNLLNSFAILFKKKVSENNHVF